LDSELKNRPRNNVFQGNIVVSDEKARISQYQTGNNVLQFRPTGIISFVHQILTDGFSPASFTQGGVSDRFSRNYALGYYILAFQAIKTSCH
jgi:hypothetical protein